MKCRYSCAIIFLIIGFLFGSVLIFSSYLAERNNLISENFDLVNQISATKVIEISSLLNKMNEDTSFLQDSETVKELLAKDLFFDTAVIQNDINDIANYITNDVENYLRAHPQMTLNDLQESQEFQEIAVQQAYKEGYSAILEKDSSEILFHKYPEFVGFDFSSLSNSSRLLQLVQRMKTGEEMVEGFYSWLEPDNEIKEKYLTARKISTKTADNKTLIVATTGYLEDYRVLNTDSDFLKNFRNLKNYSNIGLISSDGYIFYMVEAYPGLGRNLENYIRPDQGFAKNYLLVRESKNTSFYGPFIDYYGEKTPKFSIIAPVFEGETLIGYILLVQDMGKIFEILKCEESFLSLDCYLINSDRLLISPLKNSFYDFMVQSVETENAKRCFSEVGGIGHIGHDPSDILLNYEGKSVVATHSVILSPLWCLLVEVEKEEFIDKPINEFIFSKVYSFSLSVFVLVLIGFFIGLFFDRVNASRRIKKYPCGIEGRFKPLCCQIFGRKCNGYLNGKCKLIIRFRKFFINLNLWVYFVFIFIILSLFFFLYPELYGIGKIFESLMDLSLFLGGFMILIVGLKLKKKKVRKFIFIGGFLICLSVLIKILLRGSFIFQDFIPPFFGVSILILELLGYLSLLIGFRGLKDVY